MSDDPTDADVVEAIREANATALSRLGSSKAVYADTGGEMDPEPVLRAAADAEYAAAETFEDWADTESDATAAEAFAATAAEERDHYETVTGELESHDPGEPPAIQTYLRELDGTAERVGGLLGRTLAADQSKTQLTGFFTGQADPQTAGLFREMGEDLDAQLDRARELYVDLDDEGRERAREAATEAIQTAYTEYTERLEALGVNPKPVC